MRYLVRFFLMCAWVLGIVIAKGFWSTLFAVIFPFWSFYLFAEHAITKMGGL